MLRSALNRGSFCFWSVSQVAILLLTFIFFCLVACHKYEPTGRRRAAHQPAAWPPPSLAAGALQLCLRACAAPVRTDHARCGAADTAWCSCGDSLPSRGASSSCAAARCLSRPSPSRGCTSTASPSGRTSRCRTRCAAACPHPVLHGVAFAYECGAAQLYHAWKIASTLGSSLQGTRTCGDYMFSGHTSVLTILNRFVSTYSPKVHP